jgi:hypothetical protein
VWGLSLSPWQMILKVVIRDLFRKAYRKKELPDKVEIEIDLEILGQDRSLQKKIIDYCLDIGWGAARLEERRLGDNKGMFLVLERRAQKRCPSG